MSKAQLKKLGERLATASEPALDDLDALGRFRASFQDAFQYVLRSIAACGFVDGEGCEVSGRDAKTPQSIIAKLRRERTVLHRMQDIAGCRIVVADLRAQDACVSKLCAAFDGARVKDRRANPSYGYRAVHLIVTHELRAVEIQVRTRTQHDWAQFSEKVDDLSPGAKYGEGPKPLIEILQSTAAYSQESEEIETRLNAMLTDPPKPHAEVISELREALAEVRAEANDFRAIESLQHLLESVKTVDGLIEHNRREQAALLSTILTKIQGPKR